MTSWVSRPVLTLTSGIRDWLLETKDFEIIGRMIAQGSQKSLERRFAILEDGYHSDLALNIKNFIEGFA